MRCVQLDDESKDAEQQSVNKKFLGFLDSDLRKVQHHFHHELNVLNEQIEGLSSELQQLQGDTDDVNVSPIVAFSPQHSQFQTPKEYCCTDSLRTKTKSRNTYKQRLSRIVIGLWEYTNRLEDFAQLNKVALYKILKKRDRILGMHCISRDLKERKEFLSSVVVPASVGDALIDLYQQCNSKWVPTASLISCDTLRDDVAFHDFFQMKFQMQQKLLSFQKPLTSGWVFFFWGCCVMLILDIVVAGSLPAVNPTPSSDIFLMLFPMFRFSLMVCLMVWGAAVATTCFEYYGINYKFLLDIDPKCQINSSSIVSLATLLTLMWIVIFACFVFDVQFGILLHTPSYWVYPLCLFLAHLVICLLPSHSFPYTYRKHLLLNLWKTIKEAFWLSPKVTLTDNVFGDILTSIPKPLLDVYSACSFYFKLWLTVGDVQGSTTTRNCIQIVALITFFPYWIRLSQCFKRLVYESDLRLTHLSNIGKYLSSMLVILTSVIDWERVGLSVYASRLMFVLTYLFASLYNLIWDCTVDWGLLPDPDHFIRANHRILYPQWLYYGITTLNLFGRLLWALTLVPIEIINDKKLNCELILLVISSLEIIRRSAWVILRLENEHLTNSSKYRAILWVPKLHSDMPSYDTMLYRKSLKSQPQSIPL